MDVRMEFLVNISGTEPNRDMGVLVKLKESLAEVGLINPLTIDTKGRLLAGRRRYRAMVDLGWEECLVRVLDPKDELECKMISLYENLRRKPLTDPENRRMIAKIDELMRVKFGSKDKHRPDKSSGSEDLKWTDTKTAKKLGISTGSISEAKTAVAHVKKHPELKSEKTPVVLGEKRKEEIIESVPNGDKAIVSKKAKTMGAYELKEVVEKAQKINGIIKEVVRPEMKERLTEKWSKRKYEDEARPDDLLEDIRQEKGLSPVRFKQVWSRMISRLKQTSVGYPSDTMYREWTDGARHYAHLLIWADEGPKPLPLVRTDYPRAKFRDIEEADRFAAKHGGYCSEMLTIQGVEYWCLYLKEVPKK